MQGVDTSCIFYLSLHEVMLLYTYSSFLVFLQRNMLTCPSKKYLHIECMGCGMQRSILALLQGNFRQSFQFHPAGILIIAIFLFSAHCPMRLQHLFLVSSVLQRAGATLYQGLFAVSSHLFLQAKTIAFTMPTRRATHFLLTII